MTEILSILICHIPKRALMLDELLEQLEPQCRDGRAKVYVDGDPSNTVGEKRNRLLAKARGEYVCFVDDDDMVSQTYVQDILDAVRTGPDVVGMSGWYFEGDDMHGIFRHSIRFKVWDDTGQGLERWHRPPNHLNPIKRSLIPPDAFPDKNVCEDRAYSAVMLPLLKTEVEIALPIYQYIHREGGVSSGPQD